MSTARHTTNAMENGSPWPFRLALCMAACAVPLVLFGGSVTTLGAGMAVDGWLIAEGHFLVLFPIESWFRDTATFVEHTHRLFGVLVGLFAVATLVSTFVVKVRTRARGFALLALLAVCAQGALGGFRVLENDPQLAFVHGALAQAVFALLACTAFVLSPRAYGAGRTGVADGARVGLRRAATFAVLAVYGQIVLGAWYRHALRPSATDGAALRLMGHILGAFLVIAAVVLLARALDRVGTELARKKRRTLVHLIGLQIGLGVLALVGYRPGAVGPIEWILSIAHVLGGGLLLFHTAALRMWARPLDDAPVLEVSGAHTRPVGGQPA